MLFVPFPTPEYIQSTARALGFTRLVPLAIQDVVKVSQLLVPAAMPSNVADTPTQEEENYVQQMRGAMISAFCALIPLKRVKRRIYVSRANASLRVMSNETELIALLSLYDFETVFFEEMTFEQQIVLMQESDILLGVHGANLANLVFMNPGATVIEIAAPELLNNVYYRLALYTSLKYYYLVCDPETLNLVRMTGRVDIEKLRILLDEIVEKPLLAATVDEQL